MKSKSSPVGMTASGTLLKRKNGSPYDQFEALQDGSLRYMKLSGGQVLDKTTINRDGVEMGYHERKRWYEWATANIFVPFKYAQTVK